MYRVIIAGGGWAGCAAAVTARNAGAEVILLEKTDLLLGLGNVGGIMRNNGRFTAAEENIAMGADELFAVTDRCSRHTGLDFPGHRHASLYEEIEGDVFIDTAGSTGPMGNCLTYGNGCCMCILRCPAFGPRVSISEKAGVHDIMGRRKDGSYGAFSGSGKLEKQSLSAELQHELNEKGVAVIPLPEELVKKDKLDLKVCRQYALDEYAENIVLLDTGYAKIMTPFFDLDSLRRVPGFENARYVDPYAGGKGNSVRYLSVTERDNDMRVTGTENLFCGGEKSGLFVGHTEAITTGSLAGHNAVRYLKGMKLLQLPSGLATGDLISFAAERMKTEDGLMTRYTFAGAEYFQRMKDKGLYSTDREEIRTRVRRYGLENIYRDKLL